MARQRSWAVIPLVLGFMTQGAVGWAALGGSLGSIDADGTAMRSHQHTTRSATAYVVHEISNSSLRVREYLSANGQIFAVTWSGASQPDLRPLLGNYFSDFSEAIQRTTPQRRRMRAPFSRVVGERIIVERWGRALATGGRGYVRDLFPAGVGLDEIR